MLKVYRVDLNVENGAGHSRWRRAALTEAVLLVLDLKVEPERELTTRGE